MKEIIYIDSDFEGLIPMFLLNQTDSLNSMGKAIQSQDEELVQFLGHKIKGAAENYGFYKLGKLAVDMEVAGKEMDWSKLSYLMEIVKDYMDSIHIEYIEM